MADIKLFARIYSYRAQKLYKTYSGQILLRKIKRPLSDMIEVICRLCCDVRTYE